LAFWHHLLVVLLVLLVGLHYGSEFLIPLSIALLVFVLLTAIIDRIASLRPGGRAIPRWVAQLMGLGLVIFGLAGIVMILAGQASDVAIAMPRYQARFELIAVQFVQFSGEDLSNQILAEIRKVDLTGFFQSLAGSAGSILSGFTLILLYIPFMMLERAPMRSKIPLAVKNNKLAEEIGLVLRSISIGLQRYVGIKTLVSLFTGVLSYLVMTYVGLDFAETWGVLAFALNFIPTIGSIVGVAIPAVVALVQFETLTPFLVVILGCGAIQFSIGNIVEPSLTGRSLNLSPLMVILALTFWTTLWGIPGALLSVPITVVVMIVFANLPQTRPQAILMSGDGQLASSQDTMAEPPGKSQRPGAPQSTGDLD
jgi:AI-2 transport protein TqsA